MRVGVLARRRRDAAGSRAPASAAPRPRRPADAGRGLARRRAPGRRRRTRSSRRGSRRERRTARSCSRRCARRASVALSVAPRTPPIGRSPAALERLALRRSPGATGLRSGSSGQCRARWGILPGRLTAPRHDRLLPPTACKSSPPCPSACSTRAWAVSPCSTSASCSCPASTSPTSATRRGSRTARRRRERAGALLAPDHRLPRDRAGQAHRRRLLLGHVGRAAAAAGAVRRRRSSAWSCRGRERPCRPRATAASACWPREATVASGAYPRAIHSLDSGAEVIQQACPGLVDFIEAGRRRQPGAGRRRARLHRAAQGAAPGRRHHGLHALPADRAHAAALPRARRHARQPGRRDRPRGRGHARCGRASSAPGDAMGSYRFYTTGDVERFRDIGRPLPADAAHARARAAARAPRRARHAMTSRFLVRAALYAALYAALTLAPGLNALAYGQVQFRVAEALMVFACFDPAAVLGLTAGHGHRQPRQPDVAGRRGRRGALTLVAAAIMHASGRASSRWPRRWSSTASASRRCSRSCWTCRSGRARSGWASARPRCCSRCGLALLLVVRRRRELFGFTRPAA